MLPLILLLLAPPLEPKSHEAPDRRDERSASWDDDDRNGRETCLLAKPRALPSPTEIDDKWEDLERVEHQHRRLTFSAARTIDLSLGAELRPHSFRDARRFLDQGVELRLYTPKGHLYQTLALRPPAPPARRTERLAPNVWTGVLPVAGTAIVNHSLYGRWRVEPHLAGRPEPCGDAASIWIAP